MKNIYPATIANRATMNNPAANSCSISRHRAIYAEGGGKFSGQKHILSNI